MVGFVILGVVLIMLVVLYFAPGDGSDRDTYL